MYLHKYHRIFVVETDIFDLQFGMSHRLVETSNRSDLFNAFAGNHNETSTDIDFHRLFGR